ncbi:hypothetical protein P3T23_009361 [Paraburkholderia sp. GAS448]|uniref:hypothetical protein n=1 Tax=Paraburkholderia sp. GAS448 TaxID=3035136 RepID=UPI003D226662
MQIWFPYARVGVMLMFATVLTPAFGGYYERCGVHPYEPIRSQRIALTGPTTEIPTLHFTRGASALCPAQPLLVLDDNTLTLADAPGQQTIYTFTTQHVRPRCALISAAHSNQRAGLGFSLVDKDDKPLDGLLLREFSQGSADTRPHPETAHVLGKKLDPPAAYLYFYFTGTCTGQE